MPANLSLSRSQLRTLLRDKRRSLSPPQQAQAAQQLYQQLAQHPLFRRAQHIALYIAGDGEIDPQLLMHEAWRRGKSVYLPVLSRWPKTTMAFQRVRPIQQWEKIALVFYSPVGALPISVQFGLWMQYFYL